MVRKWFKAIYWTADLKKKKTKIEIPFLKEKGKFFEIIEDGHLIEVVKGKVKLKITNGKREFRIIEFLKANKKKLRIYSRDSITVTGLKDGFIITTYFRPKLGDQIKKGSLVNIPTKDINKSLDSTYELIL